MENSRGEPAGPNTTGWAWEPYHTASPELAIKGIKQKTNIYKIVLRRRGACAEGQTRAPRYHRKQDHSQPADSELKNAGQRATVVGVAVLEDPVDDELARFSGRTAAGSTLVSTRNS